MKRIFWITLLIIAVIILIYNAGKSKLTPANESEAQQVPPQKMGSGGGQADVKWQTVQSDGEEIYVVTNGTYSVWPHAHTDISGLGPGGKFPDHGPTPVMTTNITGYGYGFNTFIASNLPESDIVGAPQSVRKRVKGNCETRHYQMFGALFFTGKNLSGYPIESTGPENFERKLIPGSLFEKAFDILCKIASEQKPPVLTPDLTSEQMASRDEAAFRNLSKNWLNVTASNGKVYEVAMDTISRNPSDIWPAATLRAATVYVYGPQEKPFNPKNVQRFFFDCHDHFQTFQQDWSPVAYVPPLSVAAKVASIVCDNSAQ